MVKHFFIKAASPRDICQAESLTNIMVRCTYFLPENPHV
jgi:hypothetical protein